MKDNDRCCRCCGESLPDLDCDNVYRCFVKDRCVNGDACCKNFRPIQYDDLTLFDRLSFRIKEVFRIWTRKLKLRQE